jgi:hypothetical protein
MNLPVTSADVYGHGDYLPPHGVDDDCQWGENN